MGLNQSKASLYTSDELSLKEIVLKGHSIVKYLLSKWIIILLFAALGGIIGFGYAYSKKPSYTASTTFVLEEASSSNSLSNLGGLASIVGLDFGGSGGGIFQGDNIVELYKSRSIIKKTLITEVNYNGKKQLLLNRYIDFNGLRKSWEKIFGSRLVNVDRNLSFTRLQDSVINIIIEDIKSNILSVGKPDKKLSIISADVKSDDEFFAMEFNRQIVKNVSDYYIQTKIRKSLDNVNILQQKVDSVMHVMNGAIYLAAEVTDATPNLNPTRQSQRNVPVQRSQFSAEANKSLLSELVKNLELSKITLRKETPLIQVIDEPVFPLKIVKVSKLKSLIIGGFLGGALISIFLLLRRLYSSFIL
ncbi:MAG: Wzz/FepE/Etk N-terminal domain-containing protein [Bacteroidota bacterium]